MPPGAEDEAADCHANQWPAHVDANERPGICFESRKHRNRSVFHEHKREPARERDLQTAEGTCRVEPRDQHRQSVNDDDRCDEREHIRANIMGALDVGHRAGVQIEPLLAENRVPSPANEKIDNDQNPNREMIDLRVHKTLEIIQASELRLQLNSGTARSPRMLGRSISIKIRSGEWERILDQFKARFRVIRNDDFHNIEPEKNIRIVEHT